MMSSVLHNWAPSYAPNVSTAQWNFTLSSEKHLYWSSPMYVHRLGLPARNGDPKYYSTVESVSFTCSVFRYQTGSSRIEGAVFVVLTSTGSLGSWWTGAAKATSSQDKRVYRRKMLFEGFSQVWKYIVINKLIQVFKALGFRGCVCCHKSTQHCSPRSAQEEQALGLSFPSRLSWLRSM